MRETRPESLKEMAYHQLKGQIFSGYRRPGERLIEMDLSKELHVSRTIVREVIKQLAVEEVVQVVPFKGATVARMSIQDIDEIYTIQRDLEGLATYLAIKNFDRAHIEELERVHSASKAGRPRDALAWQKLNTRFHRAFLDHCGNSRLLRLVEGQNLQFARYWFLILSIPGRIEKSIEEHEKILCAARERRPVLGRYAMERHLRSATRDLLEFLRRIQPASIGV